MTSRAGARWISRATRTCCSNSRTRPRVRGLPHEYRRDTVCDCLHRSHMHHRCGWECLEPDCRCEAFFADDDLPTGPERADAIQTLRESFGVEVSAP